MSANTTIQWCDRTWNPVRGCSVISSGCINCYAMKQAHRFSADGKPYAGLTKQTKAGPQWTGKVVTVESALLEPLSWRKPARIFVNSMSDLFHEDVPEAFIAEVFGVMAVAGALGTFYSPKDGYDEQKYDGKVIARWPRFQRGPHTFQILTKRADRMRQVVSSDRFREAVAAAAYRHAHNRTDAGYLSHQISSKDEYGRCYEPGRAWPLPNVWLGVSVENQQYADERIPMLLETPAAVRFVSAEPLLGPIDFTLRGHRIPDWDEDWRYNVLSGEEWAGPRDDNPERSQHLDWVIVGGESGGSARPFDIAWARSIVKQCADAGVACFVKQVGSKPQITADADGEFVDRLYLFDKKGGDMAEWPPDLRVREFPLMRCASAGGLGCCITCCRNRRVRVCVSSPVSA